MTLKVLQIDGMINLSTYYDFAVIATNANIIMMSSFVRNPKFKIFKKVFSGLLLVFLLTKRNYPVNKFVSLC